MAIQNKAFTLVEMLVVIAIISILSALIVPSLHNALATANQLSCKNSQRQIGCMFQFYANDFNGWIARPTPDPMGSNYIAFYCWDYYLGLTYANGQLDNWKWPLKGDSGWSVFTCPADEVERRVTTTSLKRSYAVPSALVFNPHPRSASTPAGARFSQIKALSRMYLLADIDLVTSYDNYYDARVGVSSSIGEAILSAADNIGAIHKLSANILFGDGHAESRDRWKNVRPYGVYQDFTTFTE